MKTSPAFWSQHIKAFLGSGLSQSEYCRREGIKTHQLAYRIKLGCGKQSSLPAAPPGFARVLSAASSGPTAVANHHGAMAVFFSTSIDPSWTAKLLASIAREMK
jgi:transposase-like protein